MDKLNKFDLPAFFEREYYERHYLEQIAKGNIENAKTWEAFYFDNAVSYAFVQVFNSHKAIDSKQAMIMAEAKKKELEKTYKN